MNKTDELCELFGAARDWAGGDAFELYQRHATLLIARLGERRRVQVDRGQDSGTALRIRRAAPNGVVFAAGSGTDAAVVRNLIEGSRADYGELEDGEPWPDTQESLEDVEPSIDLPTEAEAATWLQEAVGRLEEATGPLGIRFDRVRLEIASTVESWASTPGRRMTRTRCRAFALATLRSDRTDLPLYPIRVAARHWKLLSPRAWVERVADRAMNRLPQASDGERELSLLFNPESAAQVVRGLAARGLYPGSAAGSWREDPGLAGALLGGVFDDAGFPASARTLRESADPAGGYRFRPSFRDRPETGLADIWVDATPVELPAEVALVSSVRLADGDNGRLQMEIEGATVQDGHPRARIRSGWAEADRAAWRDACRGGIGPTRFDSRGVATPALRFDGLRVRT